jgi:hypothetical protein
MYILQEMESELKTSQHIQKKYEDKLSELQQETDTYNRFLDKSIRGLYAGFISGEQDKQRMLSKWIRQLKGDENAKVPTSV